MFRVPEPRPPRIYVIGPFRAPTEYERRANIARAEALALEVAKLGAHFFCPHTHTAHFDGLLTDEYWIGLGLAWLAKCDAAVLVPGWQDYLNPASERSSHGSIAEMAWMLEHDRPVLLSADDLRAFVASWSPSPLPGDPDPAPERRCEDFMAGRPSGTCESDGHYRCRECARMASAKLEVPRV
jgi:hypothetical protein